MNLKHPTIIIVNGANWVGSKIVELMLEQKGNIIVVDDFTSDNMPFIKKFSKNKHFIFIEKDKLETIKTNFTHIKYFIHLQHDFKVGDDSISSRKFLEETRLIDELLTIAVEKKSTYLLTSSIHLHKDFLLKKNFTRDKNKNAYSESDLQDYIERTVLEYVDKAGLDGRIVRLGNIYGPEMDLSKDPILERILFEAFNKDEISISGDGLEFMYYVFISDAVQGILKSLFVENTKGKIYAITNPEEISILSIVNKVLSLNPKARSIKFLKAKNSYDTLYEKAYIPDENLMEIGWKQKVSFDRGIAQVVEYFRKDSSLKQLEGQFSNETQNRESESNDSIKFDFDDTINLANSVLEKHTEPDQFRDFYNKLNDDNSPIYNNKKQRVITSKNIDVYAEELPKSKTKSFYIKLGVFTAIGIILYIFLIVPLIRVGLALWDTKSAAAKLSANTLNNQACDLDTNIGINMENSFNSIGWLVSITNQEKLQNKLVNLSKGIDGVCDSLNTINESNLNKYLNSAEQINEADTSKIRDLLILFSQSKNNLSNASSLNLPDGMENNVKSLQSWVDGRERDYLKVLGE